MFSPLQVPSKETTRSEKLDEARMRMDEDTEEERVVQEALGELLSLSLVRTVPPTPIPVRSGPPHRQSSLICS